MAVGNRYHPPKPEGESAVFGADFSAVLPDGVGIASAELVITTNQNPPQPQSTWNQSDVTHIGKRVWATLSGGADGTDYQLQWTITDTTGNVWPRTFFCLVAETN
jgi:hypothetical protein